HGAGVPARPAAVAALDRGTPRRVAAAAAAPVRGRTARTLHTHTAHAVSGATPEPVRLHPRAAPRARRSGPARPLAGRPLDHRHRHVLGLQRRRPLREGVPASLRRVAQRGAPRDRVRRSPRPGSLSDQRVAPGRAPMACVARCHARQEREMKPQQKVLNGHAAIKVAIVQTAPVFLDRDRTIDKACAKIEEAAREGAQIIVFSEAWISGYPYWGEGGESRVGDWMDVRTRFYDSTLLVDSDDTARLCDAAARDGAVRVIVCNEMDPRPGVHTIYNSLLFIDTHGQVLGT